MSVCEEEYIEYLKDPFKDKIPYPAIVYIEELKQQVKQLQESQKQKKIVRLCNRLDKAEQQNKELRKTLKQCMTWLKKESKSMPNYDITHSVLWQSFEEMLDTGGER